MKKYLITSQEFYTDNKKLFAHRLQEQILKHTPDYILYRDKSSAHYKEIAKIFLSIRSEFAGVKAFLHGEVELAFELKADGVHLTSTQFDKIELAKSLGLKVVISSHSYEDVLSAQKLGADYVTYSPIFVSPNKGKPKGV